MSDTILRVLPLGSGSGLDAIIAEQNAYYNRVSWALYHKDEYTGDWSYDFKAIQQQIEASPYHDYAEVAPGDTPDPSLSEQRRKTIE